MCHHPKRRIPGAAGRSCAPTREEPVPCALIRINRRGIFNPLLWAHSRPFGPGTGLSAPIPRDFPAGNPGEFRSYPLRFPAAAFLCRFSGGKPLTGNADAFTAIPNLTFLNHTAGVRSRFLGRSSLAPPCPAAPSLPVPSQGPPATGTALRPCRMPWAGFVSCRSAA
jgi:hypothetical protein